MNDADRDTIHTLSGAYAVDALDHEERTAFEQHLERCPDCRAEVRSLQAAAGKLSAGIDAAPPERMRASLMDAVRATRQLPPVTDRTDPSDPTDADLEAGPAAGSAAETPPPTPFRARLRQRSRRYGAGLLAAAVLALVAGVLGVTAPWQEDRPTGAAAEILAAEDAESVSQSFPDGSSAVLTRSRSEGRAVLQTTDMPDPADGSVFQLWLLDPEGEPRPAGLMTDGGSRTVLVEGDARTAAAVAITTEPDGGSAAPSSDPIATFALDEGGA